MKEEEIENSENLASWVLYRQQANLNPKPF